MNQQQTKRRLAAILFADIVGYTSAMQVDEENALVVVAKYQQILNETAKLHDGEVIKSYGDGSLLVFNNSLEATTAAIAIQKKCDETAPKIPLRIGIHVGEFVVREGDIFGNGVNLASRIESLGVPGAVLLSEAVYLKIKNRPEFQFQSLGDIEFKNVEEPIEVFAIANEDLVVPSQQDLSGKTRKKSKGKMGSKIGWLVGFLLILLGAWLANQMLYKSGEELSEKIVKDKSLAIAVFDNQTMNEDMNSFGSMISDWITNGLKETGETNIINIANIPNASSFLSTVKKTTDEALVDQILTGRYYLNERNLNVLAELVDTKTGRSIQSFKVEKGRDALSEILSDLTQQVQTYWAIKDNKRFLQAPPKYDAYVDWKKAQNYLIEDPKKAQVLLESAFQKDTTFYSPLFNLYGLYTDRADSINGNKVFELLKKRKLNFTKFESLNYEYYEARKTGDLKLAAALSKKMFEMDQTDYNANNRAAVLYAQINHPQKSIEVLESFDERFLAEEERLLSWRETYRVFPYFLLKDYQKVGEIANNYHFPKISDALAVIHMKSLIRMDSMELLDKKFQYYKDEGLYSNAGNLMPLDFNLILVCDELYLQKKSKTLAKYVKLLEQWCMDNPQSPNLDRDIGYVLFYRGDTATALESWKNEKPAENLPGWLATSQFYDRQSRVASLQALLGQAEEARKTAKEMNSIQFEDPNLVGVPQYYSARILLALGDTSQAIARLNAAVNQGFAFFRPAVFDTDPLLKALLGHPEFEQLIRPKG